MQNLKRLSHRIINFLTKPSKQNDSYADAILAVKFDAKEAFNTVYFLVALILVSPFLEMDAKGGLRSRSIWSKKSKLSLRARIARSNF